MCNISKYDRWSDIVNQDGERPVSPPPRPSIRACLYHSITRGGVVNTQKLLSQFLSCNNYTYIFLIY